MQNDAIVDRSPRAQVQDKIVEYLTANLGKWNAPYGVLPALAAMQPKGKVRTITFGVARSLDAVCYIWTPNNITFSGQGPLSRELSHQRFESPEAAIEHLKTLVG